MIREYSLVKPVYRGSTKSITIYGANHIPVGSIQRVYKNWLQQACDFIFNATFFVNVQAFDNSGQPVCSISEQLGRDSLVRSKWTGSSIHLGEFTVSDATKIKANPRMNVQLERDFTIRLKKNIGNKGVYMMDEEDQVLAEISYQNLIFRRNITVKLESADIHILDAAALYYIFDSRNH
ncbi:hypothetical protein R70723_04260 [Paenibacillus sp. FSL R7-0273]|uniref:tubby C-terminal domain-like protein n=1 Tax=Paenibacillus sp. FSL R7-0273 TaxID=1536772 RepID=UPI0004F59218|nr:hypothetical protein [Paenibacillus sp. FSL R7-0273]AIQ45195.1 hypothetical protein R70723_04260 [Paenibacillus sp. FSL R7-0273]OMF86183.1 hypothetical protein BK144_26690 [Paenibacillus sp. FSL R7-0273]